MMRPHSRQKESGTVQHRNQNSPTSRRAAKPYAGAESQLLETVSEIQIQDTAHTKSPGNRVTGRRIEAALIEVTGTWLAG